MEQGNKRATRLIVIFVVVLAVLVTAFFALKQQFGKPEIQTLPEVAIGATEQVKTITVIVTDADGNAKTFTIETKEEFLRGALEQENLIAGDISEYGMMVTTVDGVRADDANQEWWCFTQNGEMLMTGVDATPVADGDAFEITLTVGW